MEFMYETGTDVGRMVQSFLQRVYGWMSVGLALTAGTAYYVATTPAMLKIVFGSPWIFLGLFIVQLGLVIALSAGIHKLSFGTALMLFLGYSVLSGITLSAIFLAYTYTSIASTFLVAAGMFGGMSLYGYVTKADLSQWGSFLFMGLLGLILSLLVNMWLQSPGFGLLISWGGVLIFTLLTAYDVQKLKRIAQKMSSQGQPMNQIVVYGALTLYLDFINLFLYLLRIMGQRRNN